MNFNYTHEPIRITRNSLTIPLTSVNPEMIDIQCTTKLDTIIYQTDVLTFHPTLPPVMNPIHWRLNQESDGMALFCALGGIVDAHFTNDGRVIVLATSRILYIIDIENTDNTIYYELCDIDITPSTAYNEVCYITSTDDGAVWVINKCDYYMFKDRNATVYNVPNKYTIKRENISQWGGSYLINLTSYNNDKPFYVLSDLKPSGNLATKPSENVRRVIKWNNNLLVHSAYCNYNCEYSLSFSLHQWHREARFTCIHIVKIYAPVSSISITHRILLVADERGFIHLYNEELQDILRLNAHGTIISACIYSGQLFAIADIAKYYSELDIGADIAIGSLHMTETTVDMKMEKLFISHMPHARLFSSLGFLFLVMDETIHMITGTWSKKYNRIFPSSIRKRVKTVCTLRTINALDVPREILESILVYAFSF